MRELHHGEPLAACTGPRPPSSRSRRSRGRGGRRGGSPRRWRRDRSRAPRSASGPRALAAAGRAPASRSPGESVRAMRSMFLATLTPAARRGAGAACAPRARPRRRARGGRGSRRAGRGGAGRRAQLRAEIEIGARARLVDDDARAEALHLVEHPLGQRRDRSSAPRRTGRAATGCRPRTRGRPRAAGRAPSPARRGAGAAGTRSS